MGEGFKSYGFLKFGNYLWVVPDFKNLKTVLKIIVYIHEEGYVEKNIVKTGSVVVMIIAQEGYDHV